MEILAGQHFNRTTIKQLDWTRVDWSGDDSSQARPGHGVTSVLKLPFPSITRRERERERELIL